MIGPGSRLRPAARKWSLAASLCALAALSGCGGSASAAEERATRAAEGQGELVIAAVWPWEAQNGLRYGEGLELAVEEINAAGGIAGRPLRIQREDDRESVNDGLLIAQRLAEDPSVVAVIGHLQSYVSVPAAAIYDLAGMVMLAPASTDPALTAKGYSRVFRGTFTDEDTGREMAEFAAERGYRTVAIYYHRNPYGRTLANAFEERAAEVGVSVAARASYDAAQDDEGSGFAPTLEDWKAMELDAVFVAGQVPLAGRLIAEIRRHGIDVPVLGGDAMGAPSLITEGGGAVEGTVVVGGFHADEPRPAVQTFVRAFRARYGVEPDAGSALGYDAVRVLAHAMSRAPEPTPDGIGAELRRVRGWEGVTGTFTFDESGALVGPRLLKLVVRNGRFEYLGEGALARAGGT